MKNKHRLKDWFCDKRRRIAIVGSANSGKTVFLTSLLDHMRLHKARNGGLTLNKREICKFVARNNKKSTFDVFPYEKYRAALCHHRSWPDKSTDVTTYCVRFELRSGGRKSGKGYQIEFMDLPGERVADFAMVGRDYADWSDDVLAGLEAEISTAPSDEERGKYVEFNRLVQEDGCAEETVIPGYKGLLDVAVTKKYRRLISPSTFLLGRNGKLPKKQGDDGGPGAWTSEQLCGLSETEQFAPLPKRAREKSPELAKVFTRRFEAYRKQIVMPLVGWLSGADQLYYLVDVAEILCAGPEAYNDEERIAAHVLETCSVGWLRNIKRNLFRKGHLSSKGMDYIGIVATKADQVARQEDLTNLECLLEEMTEQQLKSMSIASGLHDCAAVVSAQRTGQPNELQGPSPMNKGSDKSGEIHYVSNVPDRWPLSDEWEDDNGKAFQFPQFEPRAPQIRTAPPPQSGLDEILQLILQIK